MDNVLHAFETFFDHLQAISWSFVSLAVLCHLAKMAARSRAWRNILAAAYPQARIRWRSVFGAYAAGVGVNAVIPIRGGDALKLFLVKRRIPDATYPTLASSLLVETLVDVVLSAALIIWAISAGILPGVNVVRSLPAIDWFWLFEHPRLAYAVIATTIVLSFMLGVLASRRMAGFGRRVAQGVTALRKPRYYLTRVASLQLVDWGLRLASIYFFLRAFHVPATAGNVFRVQMTQSLSTIVPLTPAGIGTEQALIVYILRGQATRTALLSLSVGMKAVLVTLNVTIGLIALLVMLRTIHWRRVIERDTAATET
ncbi:MAG: flippase-like domain-containing protein [Actinomycetota bacterium]|nr:flippase-like domain-containing protein [Actinomycetota bacterium]